MPPQPSCCSVFELRQYTLHPGQRDVLISLFDRAFIESQEATGMHIAGQFRDEDRPDRFVWMRGFRDHGGLRQRPALAAGHPAPDRARGEHLPHPARAHGRRSSRG
ncbi:hypothetical protein [Corallococcus sp. AB049A]|uniref:hypothetical protein n=1 Tax=Corallococcus sp. AB049A TaxID=2316721 RepID=UPI001F46BE29|nr:hypothetical protein [Corallococcus sp. AB049A]